MTSLTTLAPLPPAANGTHSISGPLVLRSGLSEADLAAIGALIEACQARLLERLHDEYLTVEETAALLKVDRTTLVALERRGQLVPARVGETQRRQIIRYSRAAIAAFIQRHTETAD